MNFLSSLAAAAHIISLSLVLPSVGSAVAHEADSGARASWSQTPDAVAVRGELSPPLAGVTDLKFREFFKLPVGPRGLEPTPKLLSVDGQRVRIIGYMAQQDTPAEGVFILAPLPVSIGDADESLSDDLPPSAVFVHLPASKARSVPFIRGLIKLSGRLSVGPRDEADGRVSAVRLQLDPEIAAAIAVTQEQLADSKKHQPQNR